MSLLSASNLALRFQSDPLFQEASFEVNLGDRIGLVGPNGAGKTSLLRILAGDLQPSAGTLVHQRQLRVNYVRPLATASTEDTLEDYVLTSNPSLKEVHGEIHRLESRLQHVKLATRYAELVHRYEEQGGYRLEAEAKKVLGGLGFSPQEMVMSMGLLSSGQRARAELARLLLAPADLLLIDEPTNHLDIAAQEWLEAYLARVRAAYLMVSHDRTFLSRTTTRIFELHRGTLIVYNGDYEFYLEQRALREKQAWVQYAAQQRRDSAVRQAAERRMVLARRMTKAPSGVRHGKDYYAAKAAQVARTARILRERIAPEVAAPKPWQEDPISALDFPDVIRTSGVVLRVEGLSKAYGGKSLFQNIEFCVQARARWVILGPNGSGKSTLLRIVLGYEKPDHGKVQMGARTRPGYYAQDGDNLDANQSPLENCLKAHPNENWVRTILGCLRLRGEKAERSLHAMSAGERSKVALARLLLSGPNLLVLDEMTNHLDIESREAVEQTLLDFPGAILFTSHDRYFIKKLADEVLDLSAH